MRRLLFWGTITAGAVATYLMYRRGEPLGSALGKAVKSPVGSLVSQLS